MIQIFKGIPPLKIDLLCLVLCMRNVDVIHTALYTIQVYNIIY